MDRAHARLRSDLVFSTQQTPEGLFHIVKDPATGRFFRFREAESFILKQLECAAAMSSSGLVRPFGSSARDAHVTS